MVLGFTKHIMCGHKNLHLNRKIDGSDALYFIIFFYDYFPPVANTKKTKTEYNKKMNAFQKKRIKFGK